MSIFGVPQSCFFMLWHLGVFTLRFVTGHTLHGINDKLTFKNTLLDLMFHSVQTDTVVAFILILNFALSSFNPV